MADKIVNAVKKSRADMWGAFKKGISITGYKYYKPPPELKYRYPAPGSCALDGGDHRHMYKLDWKTPFRTSEYNVRMIELRYDDDDPRLATNYHASLPQWDASHPRFGKYDQDALDSAIPEVKTQELHPELPTGSEALKDELWASWGNQADHQEAVQLYSAPGQLDLDDAYCQHNEGWRPRGATGFENNTRMKEMFVELEYWIEEVAGAHRRAEGKVATYKGTPKKWQILDDAVYDRDQIEKIQAAADAPMPEQLEMWQEKHTGTFIQAPYTNANVQKWRDDPRAIDSADFDPQLLGYDREQKRRLFLERYEKPKELTAGSEH